ncbi:hypothetical protein BDV10DRAFT_166115 [Aspergillus recurvatus]
MGAMPGSILRRSTSRFILSRVDRESLLSSLRTCYSRSYWIQGVCDSWDCPWSENPGLFRVVFAHPLP